MILLRSLPLLFLVTLSAAVFGADETIGETTPTQPEPWAYENVELQPSKIVTWGRLENGLRYAIMPHASPPGRVSLRLLVTAGSLNENDDERGYAHFVEHMAFNGTKHFPAGELVKFLQRQGAAFGPHVNATTTYTRTLYKLELPENSASSLEIGLRVFRDFADGILFEPAEVIRERGVILSEERIRHTPVSTHQMALQNVLFAGTRIPDRSPIGLIPLIENADAPALKRFYDAWYRPENMGVVIVGKIDVTQAEALIREQFSSLAARGPAHAKPDFGILKPPTAQPKVSTHVRQMNGVHVCLFKVSPRPEGNPTWGSQLENLRINCAWAMLARRLEQQTQGPNSTIDLITPPVKDPFGKFREMLLIVASTSKNWKIALATVEQEVRRVMEHGFSPDELAFQQAILRKKARTSIRTAAIVPAPETSIPEAIAAALERGTPFAIMGETSEIESAMIDRLTVADCQRAFRESWGDSAPQIFVMANAKQMPSADKILAAYAASRKTPLAAAPAQAAKPETAAVFGYKEFGPAGDVVEIKSIPDLLVWQARYANGVRLNFKHSDSAPDATLVSIRIGTGTLSEPANQPGLHLWTAEWLFGGVGKHTFKEVVQIKGGPNSIVISSKADALVMSANTSSENLSGTLQRLAALITDPAFRPEAHQKTRSTILTQIDSKTRLLERTKQRFVMPTLSGNNPRIGWPSTHEFNARTTKELRAWITPQLASGAIEISVVGDIAKETVLEAVAKTLGALPARQPKPAMEKERAFSFPPQSFLKYGYYKGTVDLPSQIELFWPVRDPLTAAEFRRLPMLASILEDRIRDEIREKNGATYSPGAAFDRNDTYPGFAYLCCHLEIKSAEARQYIQIVQDLAAELAKAGVTPDELARAQAQHSQKLKQQENDSSYWLNSVLSGAQERPERLTDHRTAATDIATTTVDDLNILARKYLSPNLVYRFILEPDARKPKKK